eukprot:jgi/Tetstr1/421086/TSEL_012130.t2
MRQPQLLQHQVLLAALVVVIDARAPSKELRDHVWTRPTPSTVERRTMRLPASLSFRCKPAVAQHSCACRSRALSHPQGAGGGHTQLSLGLPLMKDMLARPPVLVERGWYALMASSKESRRRVTEQDRRRGADGKGIACLGSVKGTVDSALACGA